MKTGPVGVCVALYGASEIILNILYIVAKRIFVCNKDLKETPKAFSLEFKVLHNYLSEKFPHKERDRTKWSP